jgi:cysteine synthase
MTKVDVFVRWRDPFGQSQFARRQKKSVGQTPPLELFFASAEDTVLAKLEWYRKGGSVSDKQWRDLLGVLKVQGKTLDLAYLTEWASKLGIADLLARALEQIDLR